MEKKVLTFVMVVNRPTNQHSSEHPSKEAKKEEVTK